ncbi:MAG: MFS transporter [Anaerolineales bacterium]|nr:MAG: MFS transporter [Anaerolineales bacterium]
MRTTNRRNLFILVFALLVVMLGFGMVIPVFPFLIDKLGASGSTLGILVATAALTEFLFGPIWGSISDRVGRKPILMIGMFGYALAMFAFGVANQIWMLIVFRAFSGILSSATISTTMAYIGDSTSEKSRGGGMGILGAVGGAGTVIGPGIGGLLAGGSLSTPFFVSALMALLSLLLVALLLPESLPLEARTAQGQRIKLVRFDELWRALTGPIGRILLVAFLATFGTSNFESVFGLYMLKKLDYGPEQVGGILTLVGAIALIGRGLLTGFVTSHWGEPTVIKASLMVGAVGFILLLLANTYAAVLLTTGIFTCSITFLRPSIHSLTSKRTTVGQGTSMGLSNSFVSLGRIVGPIVAGLVFDINPNLPYLAGALILSFVFLMSLMWVRDEHHSPDKLKTITGQT